MADPAGRLWLFGGRLRGAPTGELWSYDLAGHAWKRHDAPGPAPRWGHTAVFDERRGRVVVFSGQAPGGFFNDAWAFDTDTGAWRELASAGPRPALRYGSCAGYDPEGDAMYISHGFTSTGRFDDTWRLGLATGEWRELASEGPRPLKRCLHQCAFQEGALLLFGGQSNEEPFLGDLWRNNVAAGAWTEVSPTQQARPAPRFFSGLAADPPGGGLFLFGGVSDTGRLGDLWRHTEAGWSLLGQDNPPPARGNHATAWVEAEQALYLFGGNGGQGRADLWRVRPTP